MLRLASRSTAAVLAAIAGIHLLWARGSSFPFATRAELADAVVGTDEVPPPAACVAVAVALVSGAALVGGAPGIPRRLRRLGITGVVVALGGRAAFGFVGQTERLSPGSESSRFRELDRRIFSPLCLALALGAAAALADTRRAATKPSPARPDDRDATTATADDRDRLTTAR